MVLTDDDFEGARSRHEFDVERWSVRAIKHVTCPRCHRPKGRACRYEALAVRRPTPHRERIALAMLLYPER